MKENLIKKDTDSMVPFEILKFLIRLTMLIRVSKLRKNHLECQISWFIRVKLNIAAEVDAFLVLDLNGLFFRFSFIISLQS